MKPYFLPYNSWHAINIHAKLFAALFPACEIYDHILCYPAAERVQSIHYQVASSRFWRSEASHACAVTVVLISREFRCHIQRLRSRQTESPG